MTRLTNTARFAPAALIALMASGCFGGYDGAFIEAEDVSLDMPNQISSRAFEDEQGDVYLLIEETATDVNGWVSETVQGIATVVAFLNSHRETSRDGDWRVYGPINDDEDRDLAWMIKIQGDATFTKYEAYVGERGAKAGDMRKLLDGDITIGEELRTGGFTLYYDAVEYAPAVKDFEDAGVTYAGEIDVTFERDITTERKTIGIDFRGFEAMDIFGQAWRSDETYSYDRTDDGSGRFHLAVNGTFDDNAWGGIKTNRLQLDARWNPDEEGRTRGYITDVEHEDSGLPDGDLTIHECFDGQGTLTWREINEEYAADMPGYNQGEEDTCVFTEGDLDAS